MIDSPCNDICTTDPESGLCVGCGRTQEEISNWLFFDDDERHIITKRCLEQIENLNKK